MPTYRYTRHCYQLMPLLLLMSLMVPASWASSPASADKRVALVIGNSHYQHLRALGNPAGDAQAVAARLQTLGFTLIGSNGKASGSAVLDLGENAFSTAVKRFARSAKGAEIALIYYAGHGMQMGEHSYLLPVDVPGDDLDLVQRNAISLDRVLRRLDGKAKLTVAVFDACREIPELEQVFEEETRSSGLNPAAYRGLARVQSRGRSRIVAFAGAAGELVADGRGQHSPYTETLLAELTELDRGNSEVGDLFRQVAWRFGQTRGGQQPEILIQGVPPRQFYFSPNLPNPVPPPPPPGYLQVSVDVPSAQVSVNGRAVGEAGEGRPLNLTNLPAGTVTIRVQSAGQQRERRETIRPGQWTQSWFTLQVSGPNGAVPTPPDRIAQHQADPASIEQALGLKREDRRQVQQALNALGYPVGSADGVWGAKTRSGIGRWQQSKGQTGSGYLDAAAYKALLAEARPKLAAARATATTTAGQRFHDALRGGGQGPEMVVIPAGSFEMGSNNGDDDEKPVHRVRISRAFALSRTEVTVGDYKRFVNASGHQTGASCYIWTETKWDRDSNKNWRAPGFSQDDSSPVVCVNWGDANAYAKWLSGQTGERYRLPTEAEWEYAARAGSRTDYWWGNAIGKNRANCDGCGSRWDNKKTAPVGSFSANRFGLYDTAGNVWEWVADWYANSYPSGTQTDPTGPSSGSNRVRRGGSWYDTPRFLRSAFRYNGAPGYSYSNLGFRLARTL